MTSGFFTPEEEAERAKHQRNLSQSTLDIAQYLLRKDNVALTEMLASWKPCEVMQAMQDLSHGSDDFTPIELSVMIKVGLHPVKVLIK
jgi:hypothetical protein